MSIHSFISSIVARQMNKLDNHTELQKKSAVPLYYQIEMSLRSRLRKGEFAPGDDFPSESALVQDYSVSRMTVRQSLAALERDGLIHRKRGRGTIVTEEVRHLWAPKLTGSLDDAILFGLAENYRVNLLGREDVAPSPQVITGLRLRADTEKVHRIRRTRFYRGEPLAYIVNYIPADIGCKIGSEDILSRLVLANLEIKAGLRLMEAEQKIGATAADPELAMLLKIQPGDPLVYMERIVFDDTGRAVNFTLVFFRADRYWYEVKLMRNEKREEINWRLK
jgi:GntR family transcriptional regulator